MNSSTYTTGYHRGRADALLDLVWRMCPTYMRIGGLVSNQEERMPLGPEVRVRVVARFKVLLREDGGVYDCRMLHTIAAEEKLHPQTVVKFTAPIRHAKKLRAAYHDKARR